MRTKAYRRYKDQVKIKHKIKYAYGYEVSYPGMLRKGKNFCSCSMCTPKTNCRGKTISAHGGRSSSKARYKGHNWKHSDKKKIASCKDSLKEWDNENCRYWNDEKYDIIHNEKKDSQ